MKTEIIEKISELENFSKLSRRYFIKYIGSVAMLLAVPSIPSQKKFSVIDIVSSETGISRGVSAFMNPEGDLTKDQAGTELTRILNTIPGTRFFVFDVFDDNNNKIAVLVANNEENGQFDKSGASIESSNRLLLL